MAGIILGGTAGGETLTGTAENDSIYGNGGNDRLYGGGGNDSLFSGEIYDAATGKYSFRRTSEPLPQHKTPPPMMWRFPFISFRRA